MKAKSSPFLINLREGDISEQPVFHFSILSVRRYSSVSTRTRYFHPKSARGGHALPTQAPVAGTSRFLLPIKVRGKKKEHLGFEPRSLSPWLTSR